MKVKNCPFCGEEVKIFKELSETQIGYGYKPKCTNLDCIFSTGGAMYNSVQEAIARCNRREPMDRIVENLEEKVAEARKDYNNYEDGYYEGKEDGVREAIEIVKGGQMRILTKCGMEIYCLPDTAECGMTEKSPEEMGSCPIYNFDDTGDICVPELCDFYGE